MSEIIKNLSRSKVLVIGDCMLDTYYEGDAERISPEAPVPVVKVERTRHLLGGAANVARNISSLGANCELISIVGNDFAGEKIQELLKNSQIKTSLMKNEDRPSTVKSRILARNQQVLRFDREVDDEITNAEKAELLKLISRSLASDLVIILSDYGKGLIYENLIVDINAIAKENKISSPKILIDPKPKNKNFYNNSYLLTPNTKEAEELSGIKINSEEDIINVGKILRKKLKAENLLITLGSKGMALFSESRIIHINSTAKQVYDVTGAGDTVIATLATCIGANIDLEVACEMATLAAGIVVEKVGSAVTTTKEIATAYQETKINIETWV